LRRRQREAFVSSSNPQHAYLGLQQEVS